MTRLTKSSSLGGATPTVRPSQSRAADNQLLGSATDTSGVQVSGPLKTTISPGSGSPNQYGTLLTSTRSPVQPVQPCRVCSIEPDGMKNAWTKNVLTSRASTKAITSSTGSSRSSEPFLARARPRRPRPELRWLVGRPPVGVAAGVDGSSAAGSPAARASAGSVGPCMLIAPSLRSAAHPARQPARGTSTSQERDRAGCAMRNRPDRDREKVSARDDVALLLDLRGLAAQLAEVVQLGPADVTAGQHLDLLHDRGVHWEGALHADAEAALAHGEGLADAATLSPDDDALEALDARAVALDDPHVHLHGVPGAEVGDVVAQRRGVEGVQGVHRSSPQS